MRSLNRVGRGVLVVAVVCALSMPVQAATRDDDWGWMGRTRERVVKLLKRLGGGVTSLGDMLGDPRP